MGVIIIYGFAVWGFLGLKDEMVGGFCTTPGHCFLNIMATLAGGDMGGVMSILAGGDVREDASGALDELPEDTYFHVWLYQFAFFVIVITILLNVIFGIIIDTFGELRGERAFNKANMENVCFICGIDRFTFDTKGDSFETHIRDDHYMWDYLYLMIHVREKDPTEYNGWETYIAAQMAENDTSFMPRNTAMVLEKVKDSDIQMRDLERRVGRLADQNATLLKSVEIIRRTVLNEDTGAAPPGVERSRSAVAQNV